MSSSRQGQLDRLRDSRSVCASIFDTHTLFLQRPSRIRYSIPHQYPLVLDTHISTAGHIITLTQFALTALLTLPSQLSPSTTISFNPPKFNLSLLPRQIPLTTWLSYTLIFLLVNVLNNLAFSHDISVPVHIILRSGGSVTTMLVGYLVAGKLYTRTQVTGVLLLTAGVILAALSDAQAQGRIDASSPSPKNGRDTRSFTIGLLLLLVAQTLSAYMGLYIQQIYTALSSTSKPWRENLFYSHAIALPFFLPLYPSLASQFRALMNSPPLSAYLPEVSLPPSDLNT
jgi:solute carrier family 35 (UDP-xylose/UDP-N-acetylglucosamine transporter), member B4